MAGFATDGAIDITHNQAGDQRHDDAQGQQYQCGFAKGAIEVGLDIVLIDGGKQIPVPRFEAFHKTDFGAGFFFVRAWPPVLQKTFSRG